LGDNAPDAIVEAILHTKGKDGKTMELHVLLREVNAAQAGVVAKFDNIR
jgi:hypothetical protein